jgi:hypothetical protein
VDPLPERPPLADVADEVDGHYWVQELVAGAPLRFALGTDGAIAFADGTAPLADPPERSLRASVRHVRERLDRAAVREAVPDPAAVTFSGVATRHEGVAYDFQRLPPFLLADVRGPDGRLLPADEVAAVAERVGLEPVPTVRAEVRAAHEDPQGVETPPSAYRDGPAAGVVVREKAGVRGARRNDAARRVPDSLPGEPAAAAAVAVTTRRVRDEAERLAAAGREADFDAVFDRVLEQVYRAEHGRFPHDVDHGAFRSAAAERVREAL